MQHPMKQAAALAMAALWLTAAHAQDWPVYGGDDAATRYSSAHQIDRGNVF